MPYLDADKIKEQHRRLKVLAAEWRSEYGVHQGGVLEDAVARYLDDSKAVHDDAVRAGEPDDTDEAEMLTVCLWGAFRHAHRLDGGGGRLTDFYLRKPDVESSDELDFIKRENDLASALDLELHIPTIGQPGFERILSLWEGLPRSQVYNYGFDDGLARTLAAYLPVAEAYLAVAGGIEGVDRYAKFDRRRRKLLRPGRAVDPYCWKFDVEFLTGALRRSCRGQR